MVNIIIIIIGEKIINNIIAESTIYILFKKYR